jgi:acylphosphatase
MGTEAARVRLIARVEGRVQGVGYRAFVLERAVGRNLDGWVRNLPGGDVDLEAEGPRPALESLLLDLNEGPPASRVQRVHSEWAPARGLRGFEIRRI